MGRYSIPEVWNWPHFYYCSRLVCEHSLLVRICLLTCRSVDNQGLYYDNSELCSAAGMTFGSSKREMSLGVWFKYQAAGSIITLKNGATAYLDLRATASGFTVVFNGLTSTFTCGYGNNTYYLLFSIEYLDLCSFNNNKSRCHII